MDTDVGVVDPVGPPAFKVRSFVVEESLLWAKPDGSWAWRLTAVEDGTRLVTRIHAVYDWRHPFTAAFGMLLMEFGDFAMQRRMLRGIKARAESHDVISWPREPAASPVCARARVPCSPYRLW